VEKAKEGNRKIELEYSLDRLSAKKIGQAYQILVPDKTWQMGSEEAIKHRFGETNEGSWKRR
jgi:hypothetical protein